MDPSHRRTSMIEFVVGNMHFRYERSGVRWSRSVKGNQIFLYRVTPSAGPLAKTLLGESWMTEREWELFQEYFKACPDEVFDQRTIDYLNEMPRREYPNF